MKKIRLGIVGAGFAAGFHVESLRRVYGIEVQLAGVTSLHKESCDKFGNKHNITSFDSVEAMLDHIDVLDICSPPYVHEEGLLAAAAAGKGIICEKPLTGYFGPDGAGEEFRGDKAPKEPMLLEVIERLQRIARAVRANNVLFGYAENYIYTPSIQKEREIIEKTGAQVLRMIGEESHNGSASPVYGIWRFAGGGALMGKSCHPLGGMLYLKEVEGLAVNGKPIRPASVSARTHQITRNSNFRDKGLIRTDYHDIEDYGFMHIVFEDGTIGDVIASELVLGGCYDYVEVFANNHRTRCHISPVGIVDTYNPIGNQYADIYVVEKASTKEGWSQAAPDENFTMGYHAEMQDFLSSAASGQTPQCGLELALDTITTIYAAYLSSERDGEEVEVKDFNF